MPCVRLAENGRRLLRVSRHRSGIGSGPLSSVGPFSAGPAQKSHLLAEVPAAFADGEVHFELDTLGEPEIAILRL